MAVSGIVANSNAFDVRYPFEFFDPFDRRDLVRNVFNHDFNTREGANLRNGRISVFERNGAECIFRISQMHHHIRQPNVICQFERALDLIHRCFAMPTLRLQYRDPSLVERSRMFDERQMQRWIRVEIPNSMKELYRTGML